MNKSSGNDVIQAIGDTVMRWQDATQRFDEEVGARYGLNAADRHCLCLLSSGDLTPSAIARTIRLTPPSVTALIDRLEKRGFLCRERSSDDRRKVMIVATPKTIELAQTHYGPIVAAARATMSSYTPEELEAIMKFVSDALLLQEHALNRVQLYPSDCVT